MGFIHKIKRQIQRRIIKQKRKIKNKQFNKFWKKFGGHGDYGTRYNTTRYTSNNKFEELLKLIKDEKNKTIIKSNGKSPTEFIIGETRWAGRTAESPTEYHVRVGNIEISWIGLGIDGNSLIIESMQNLRGEARNINRFKSATDKPPLDFLIQEVEKKARQVGLSEVKIRRPETLAFYQKVYDANNQLITNEAEKETIRARIRKTYNSHALRNKYKKEKLYYTKKL